MAVGLLRNNELGGVGKVAALARINFSKPTGFFAYHQV